MEAKSVRITPSVAEQWLNKNTSNRKLRDGVVEKYAHDMRNKKWTKCPVPISFYTTGEVADGQHRLWAIIESKTTQYFLVVKGLTKDDGLNIDMGLGRSLVDNAKISGFDPSLSNLLISTCRAIDEGDRSKGTMSSAQRLVLVEKHNPAAQWALANMPVKMLLRNSITLAALGRAWYHENDKTRLAEFGKVFATGVGQGQRDSAAIALRNYFLLKRGIASNPRNWKEVFHKTQNAIRNFMQGKEISKVRLGRFGEIYPLPKAKIVVGAE